MSRTVSGWAVRDTSSARTGSVWLGTMCAMGLRTATMEATRWSVIDGSVTLTRSRAIRVAVEDRACRRCGSVTGWSSAQTGSTRATVRIRAPTMSTSALDSASVFRKRGGVTVPPTAAVERMNDCATARSITSGVMRVDACRTSLCAMVSRSARICRTNGDALAWTVER
uniref:(northern house mosquito) hypothetical protein n=1 Tax=Culex pipiens TaxID=7175 RepID=A0A8D8PJW2_CULPI